jgi:cytochrome c553
MRALILVAAALVAGPAAAQDLQARNLAAGCAICHGTEGHAVTKDMVSLAGLPKEHIAKQLRDSATASGRPPSCTGMPRATAIHRLTRWRPVRRAKR